MEITQSNFDEKYEEISLNLKSSCFIGFDAEFSAILNKDCFKYRLFDANEERYDQLKNEISNMIITQIGLTVFIYDRTLDMYNAISYTFHLRPQVFADIDQSFIFQASTLQFLCRYNFDFNKFIYDGIPYLSKHEEVKLRKLLKNNNHGLNYLTQSLSMEDEKLLQNHYSQVSKWLIQSDEDTMYIDVKDPILSYTMHMELRKRFPDILTTYSLGQSNMTLLYKNKTIEGATNAPVSVLEEKFLNHVLGFSRIFRLLEEYKKPIIGHNILLDLLLMHNQFIGPLPKKYSAFKENIVGVLPRVYDTKYISREMGKQLTFHEKWPSNALQSLYEFFYENKCKRLGQGLNFIQIVNPFNHKQSYHEAGWDSYITGYCFIRLGHWAACQNSGHQHPVSPTEILANLHMYSNKVNVTRASVPYMNLDDIDPPRNIPKFLHVRCLREKIINIGKVASLMSTHGMIDVKPHGARSALVAIQSQHTVNKIIKQFKDSCDYKVTMYSALRHTLPGQMALWGSAILTGGLMLYFLQRRIKTLKA